MLGWWFVVRRVDADDWSTPPVRDELHLATWETGVSGTKWIEDLVVQGIAQKTLSGGYPNRYLSPAAPVMDLLLEQMQGPTAAPKTSADWREGKFVTAAISACPRDAQLLIEAWDQS